MSNTPIFQNGRIVGFDTGQVSVPVSSASGQQMLAKYQFQQALKGSVKSPFTSSISAPTTSSLLKQQQEQARKEAEEKAKIETEEKARAEAKKIFEQKQEETAKLQAQREVFRETKLQPTSAFSAYALDIPKATPRETLRDVLVKPELEKFRKEQEKTHSIRKFVREQEIEKELKEVPEDIERFKVMFGATDDKVSYFKEKEMTREDYKKYRLEELEDMKKAEEKAFLENLKTKFGFAEKTEPLFFTKAGEERLLKTETMPLGYQYKEYQKLRELGLLDKYDRFIDPEHEKEFKEAKLRDFARTGSNIVYGVTKGVAGGLTLAGMGIESLIKDTPEEQQRKIQMVLGTTALSEGFVSLWEDFKERPTETLLRIYAFSKVAGKVIPKPVKEVVGSGLKEGFTPVVGMGKSFIKSFIPKKLSFQATKFSIYDPKIDISKTKAEAYVLKETALGKATTTLIRQTGKGKIGIEFKPFSTKPEPILKVTRIPEYEALVIKSKTIPKVVKQLDKLYFLEQKAVIKPKLLKFDAKETIFEFPSLKPATIKTGEYLVRVGAKPKPILAEAKISDILGKIRPKETITFPEKFMKGKVVIGKSKEGFKIISEGKMLPAKDFKGFTKLEFEKYYGKYTPKGVDLLPSKKVIELGKDVKGFGIAKDISKTDVLGRVKVDKQLLDYSGIDKLKFEMGSYLKGKKIYDRGLTTGEIKIFKIVDKPKTSILKAPKVETKPLKFEFVDDLKLPKDTTPYIKLEPSISGIDVQRVKWIGSKALKTEPSPDLQKILGVGTLTPTPSSETFIVYPPSIKTGFPTFAPQFYDKRIETREVIKPTTREEIMTINIEKLKPDLREQLKVDDKLKQFSGVKVVEKSFSQEKIIQTEGLNQFSGLKEVEKSKEKEKLKEKEQLKFKTYPELTTFTPFKYLPTTLKTPFIPLPSRPKGFLRTTRPSFLKSAFEVQIRRRGRFITIGKDLPLKRAKKLGVKVTMETLGQTFRLVKKGYTKTPDISFEIPSKIFTIPKKPTTALEFVERRGKTLKKGTGEIREIQIARSLKGKKKQYYKRIL